MSEYTQCDKCSSVSHNQAIHCARDGCGGHMVIQRSCSGCNNLMRQLSEATADVSSLTAERDAYKANWIAEKRETDALRAEVERLRAIEGGSEGVGQTIGPRGMGCPDPRMCCLAAIIAGQKPGEELKP